MSTAKHKTHCNLIKLKPSHGKLGLHYVDLEQKTTGLRNVQGRLETDQCSTKRQCQTNMRLTHSASCSCLKIHNHIICCTSKTKGNKLPFNSSHQTNLKCLHIDTIVVQKLLSKQSNKHTMLK